MDEAFFAIVFATLLFVVLPIVIALLAHQRKMAEIIHGKRGQQTLPDENQARMLQEISQLKQLVSQQTLTLDNLQETQRQLEQRLAAGGELGERLKH
jgi:hypothetical protein